MHDTVVIQPWQPSQDNMTCMAVCTPAPQRFVAAKRDDVQMKTGGLIQQHNVA